MANHVHATLHEFLSLVPVHNRTPETANKLLEKNWRRYGVGFKDESDERRWLQRALGQITRFVREQDVSAPPMMLKKPIEAAITPGVVLQGRVDRVDRHPDGTSHIIDYKTGTLPQEIDWTQLEIHALTLSRSGYHDVRTMSYLYLLPGIVHRTELEQESLNRVAWEVMRVAEEIREEKHYLPSPGVACAGCDFTVICWPKDEHYRTWAKLTFRSGVILAAFYLKSKPEHHWFAIIQGNTNPVSSLPGT